MDYDVLIIGAGMSGLAAGIRLAHFGKRVVICEKHALVGGLNSYFRRHGREFDVGLHAMTNFARSGDRSAPLNRLLRQLRLEYTDLRLQPQGYSEIRFPQETLRFTNHPADLEEAVARSFPGQADGFRALTARVRATDRFALADSGLSTRAVLKECITDPLLVEMLLCPLLFYGSATPDDMDFNQFCVMFQSLYLEGFARPEGGVRTLLKLLLDRFREAGGELRLRGGVAGIRDLPHGEGKAVRLDDGAEVTCGAVLSCAGYHETLRLCVPDYRPDPAHPEGQLSFVETILVTSRPVHEAGFGASILFFNTAEHFHYRRPSRLTDARSGVVCAPGNFAGAGPGHSGEDMLRITQLADHEPWMRMDDDEYQEAKDKLLAETVTLAESFVPGIRDRLVCTDMFTPRTIVQFTGHLNGAVYGAPVKAKDGVLPVPGVFLCGTDQGFLGITGALLSGTSIANRHLLRASP